MYSESECDYDKVINLVKPRVSYLDNVYLLAPFTKKEFKTALFQMHPDKASGSDGFNLVFFFSEILGYLIDEIFSVCLSFPG